jgi:hypothetical protein
MAGWSGQKGAHTMFTITTTESRDIVTIGKLATSDGVVYLLTRCCEASAKGGLHGVICRNCHTPVPDLFGMAWMAEDFRTEYPIWCDAQGMSSDDPARSFIDRYTERLATELGI